MRQYSAASVDFTFIGQNLTDGIAEGTFLTISPAGPDWAFKRTGHKKLVRSKLTDRSRTIALTLDMASREHRLLLAMRNTDEVSGGVVGLAIIRDGSSGDVFTCENTCIEGPPEREYGQESSNVTWNFVSEYVTEVPGDTSTNAVGE